MAIWVGGAPAVKQLSTGTVAGTPANTETLTVTCNSKAAVLTIPAGQTTSQVAAEVVAMVNANTPTDPAPATGYTRSVGGREIPEFRDFIAEQNGSVVNFYSVNAGTPFTITLSETMAAGTFTLATPTAATGPNHADNAANYRDGVLPANGESFSAEGIVDILYGLGFMVDGSLQCSLYIDLSLYTGQIGLPAVNAGGGYDEYRDRHLELKSENTTEKPIVFYSSQGSANSSKPIFIMLGAQHSTLDVIAGRGTPPNPNIEFVRASGGSTVEGIARVTAGSVKFSIVTFTENVYLGSETAGNNSRCFFDSTCSISGADNFWLLSGYASIQCPTEGMTSFRVYGGTCELSYPFADASTNHCDLIEVFGGGTLLVSQRGATTGSTIVEVFGGGVVDFRPATTHLTFTRIKLHAGAGIYDPQGFSGTSAGVCVYDLEACTWDQLSVRDVQPDKRYTTAVIT